MKHSTSYNSPGSLSSPVVIAAAFPSAAGTSCSSSLHSLRPQRWSRSHRTTPHPPQRPPNVTSSISTGLHANRTSARSLKGTQDKTIQRESISSNQGNSITVQLSHVQRRQKQQRQQPNNTTSVESEANVEEKAEDAMRDSVGVKATRKAKRRQTRRRRQTSPLQVRQQQQEVVGQLPVIHSDKVLEEDVKTKATAPAAQKESKLIIVSSTTQASEKAHKQEEEKTPPKRRQRRRRRRAQQRQTRRQQSAKDIKVNPTVTATTPILRESSQGPEQKLVKDNSSNTTPTNATTTTTASSVASSCPHDQHKARSSRHEEADATHAIATATEKPKRVRRRRQRRQRPRREAASSTQQQPQHPLLLVRERMEDNVASMPAVVKKDATESSLALNQVASHSLPSALPTHLPVAALLSVPPAALRHSAPTTTTTSALNNVSRLTSAANEEEREDTTIRRVGALPVFPSRPDLTQLTYNELSLFDSTTAAAFSLSSGTGGVRGGDEDGESTSPMTLATSCSPTSIHAPTSNGVHIASSYRQNSGVTTQEVVEDEVGLRRRGLRVRAVAFQPRNSSGDEKDNNNNTAGESTGASFGVRRRRGRRAVRPGAVLARHNYSVSDIDNVQHSCVAMSDVVAKDETLMFNMLVGNAEGDVDLVAGGDEVHMNDEAAAENELNDDEDDDEEEEEVLMDLCGLRGAVPRTAPMPRHIAPGGGYWSEDNYTNNNNSSSAVGGRSSYERSAYYYSMSYARAASRNSLTTSQSQVQPPHLHRQRSQPSLSYYETLTPQIAALLLPPAPNSASRDPSPTRTFRGTMSVMSTNEAMTDVDQWEMNSSVYEESLDEAQVQWIEEQLRASENPEGFFG